MPVTRCGPEELRVCLLVRFVFEEGIYLLFVLVLGRFFQQAKLFKKLRVKSSNQAVSPRDLHSGQFAIRRPTLKTHPWHWCQSSLLTLQRLNH